MLEWKEFIVPFSTFETSDKFVVFMNSIGEKLAFLHIIPTEYNHFIHILISIRRYRLLNIFYKLE